MPSAQVRDCLPRLKLAAMLEEVLCQPCIYLRLHRHLSLTDRVALSSLWPTERERTQSDPELTALLTALQKESAFLEITDATAPKPGGLRYLLWVLAQGGSSAAYAVRERRGWTFHTPEMGSWVGWRPFGIWQDRQEYCDFHLTFTSLLKRIETWLGQRHGLFCVHPGMTDSLGFFPVGDMAEARLVAPALPWRAV